MEKYIKYLIALAVLIVVLFFSASQEDKETGAIGLSQPPCSIYSIASQSVGTTSRSIYGGYSRLASLTIQAPNAASSTIFIQLGTTSAVAGTGIALNPAMLNGVTTSPALLRVGLATDIPYTGPITAIVERATVGVVASASTTVLVTECRY